MPVRLHKMGRLLSPACMRCKSSRSDFWHKIWDCPVIREYWSEVNGVISEVLNVPVPLTPEVCLFEFWTRNTGHTIRKPSFGKPSFKPEKLLLCDGWGIVVLR